MSQATVELLGRVSRVVGEQPEWFEAMQEWYGYATLTRAAVEALVGSRDGLCRLSVAANGRTIEEGYRHVDPRFHRVSWQIPASALREGENEVALDVEPGSTAPLLLESASAGAATVWLSEPELARGGEFWLTVGTHAAYDGGRRCWVLQADGGRVRFALWLRRAADTTLTLSLAAGPGKTSPKLLAKLFDKVLDAVEDRLKKLAAEARRRDRGERVPRQTQQDLDDVQEYERLHRGEIEQAVHGEPGITLAAARARAAALGQIFSTAAPEPVKPPPRVSPASAAGAAPAAGVGFGRVVAWLFLLAVVGGGIAAYVAYRNGSLQISWLNSRANGAAPDRQREAELVRRLNEKKANTGEVQISLGWENKNDLDLHVVCPSGQTIYHSMRQSKCGGRLDVDMNVGFEGASDRPVENVFWAKAPKGKYQIHVNHFRNHGQPGCADPTRFAVRVQIRGASRLITGEVVHADANRRKVPVHEFTLD